MGTRRMLKTEGALKLIEAIGSGKFNTDAYPDIAEHGEKLRTITCRRAFVKAAFNRELARMNASARVVEISARPGDAPAGITGVVRAANAGNDDNAQGVVAKYDREHRALAVRRTDAEVAERQATARAQEALALEREAAAALHAYNLAQAKKHESRVDAKMDNDAVAAAALAKKATLEVEAAEAMRDRVALEKAASADTAASLAKKAALEVQLVQQELDQRSAAAAQALKAQENAAAQALKAEENAAAQALKAEESAAALELQLKKAAAAEERQNKRKREEDAKATLEDQRRERIRALERIVRAAPTKLGVADELNELADLYVKAGDSKNVACARRRSADLWRRSHLVAAAAAPPAPSAPSPEPATACVIPACGVSIFASACVFDDEADEGVYVVAESLLPDSREYVGYSKTPSDRVRAHASGTGGVSAAAGFQIRRPLLTRGPLGKDREYIETIERMHAHGHIEKVQGAQFVGPNRDLRAAYSAICQKWDLCFQCGEPGHYASNFDRTVKCSKPPRYDVEGAMMRRC